MKNALAISLLALSALTGNVVQAVVNSLQNDLEYDENGKLKGFQLVYPLQQDQKCPEAAFATGWYGYETHAVTGQALKEMFPNYNPEECAAVCLYRGVDKSLVQHVMPHQRTTQAPKDFRIWFENSCHKVEVCLMNYLTKENDLTLYWVNHKTGQKRAHKTMPYGERNTRCFESYLGHQFEVYNKEELVEKFIIEHTLVRAFGESPNSDTRAQGYGFDTEIETTLRNEWKRHNRVKRTFSALGFSKGKLPLDVFASMSTFYYNNRGNKVREEWGGKGVFVNWWETDVSFIQIPWLLKELWQGRLADLVSAWAGVEVEQTVMYGLRQYEDGARLLTHVDRTPTHAVSLIVNVAQGNLTNPWPVEVFDHADRLHEVLMEPGDIVYYESAKNLHSRNRPLNGDNAYYVNLFTHYRPRKDGDAWYTKPNQPGVPNPVLEVEGHCRLEPTGTTATASGQLGVVQQVRCDDARLGPYISPTFFKLQRPEDMIEWWRRTARGYVPTEESTATDRGNENDEL